MIKESKRRQLKKLLVSRKGGKCEICGYNKCIDAFDFHHVDKKKKVFNISENMSIFRLPVLLDEVEKCILVCKNCHALIHAGEIYYSQLNNK